MSEPTHNRLSDEEKSAFAAELRKHLTAEELALIDAVDMTDGEILDLHRAAAAPAPAAEVTAPPSAVTVKHFTAGQAAVYDTLDAAGRARMDLLFA